jgi:hypothetical protein
VTDIRGDLAAFSERTLGPQAQWVGRRRPVGSNSSASTERPTAARSAPAALERRPSLFSAHTTKSVVAVGRPRASLTSRLSEYADDDRMRGRVDKLSNAICERGDGPALGYCGLRRRVLGRELWPHQVEATRSSAFVTTVAAARRTGKTLLAERWRFTRPFSNRGCRILILSATQDGARRLTEMRGYGENVLLVILGEAGFMPPELRTAGHYTALDERANGSSSSSARRGADTSTSSAVPSRPQTRRRTRLPPLDLHR